MMINNDYIPWFSLRLAERASRSLMEICHFAWQEGFMKGWSGNASVRISTSPLLMVITASGASKGRLAQEDCILMDANGNALCSDRKPSSEWRLHAAAYAAFPECGAVLHTHPQNLQALDIILGDKAGAGWEDHFLDVDLYEAEVFRKRLYFALNEMPGSETLAEGAINSVIADGLPQLPCAVWLKKHGLCAFADKLENALAFTEEVDHLAGVQLKVMQSPGKDLSA